jgi:N-acetylglucosamine kinase
MAELIAHACYGIDIGGTKIELVACDAAMQVTWRRRGHATG